MTTAAVQEQKSNTNQIRTAVRHSAVFGLGGILAKALGFLMLPFYTRYLSPADYGVLEILDLSMSLLGMFLNMGLTAALLRCYTGAASDGQRKKAVSTAFLCVAGTGIAAFVIAASVYRPVSTLLFGGAVPASCLLLSFASFTMNYISNLPRTYLRALQASGAFVLVDTFTLVLMLILNIYFIAVLRIGLQGVLLSSVIAAGIQVVLLSGWTIHRVGLGFSGSLMRRMARFGVPLILSNVAMFALNFSDRFFLQHLRSLDAVGVYAIGYKFAFMMNYLLIQPFYAMWQSRMYIIHAEPGHPRIFGDMFMLYCLLLTWAGLGLSLFSSEVVRLMAGESFSASQDVIPIVALAYVCYGAGYFVQAGLFITNNTRVIALVSGGAAALNLVLNYFLILHFGMLGAAWATLAGFACLAGGCYVLAQRVCPLPLAVGRASIALAVAVAIYLACRMWPPEATATVLLVKVLMLVSFPVVLWKIRIITPSEIDAVVALGGRRFAAVGRWSAALRGRTVRA